MRTPLTLALCLVLVALTAGCDKKPSDPAPDGATESPSEQKAGETTQASSNEPKIVYAEGEQPGPDTVLAEAGDVEVTLGDFQDAMRRSMLLAPKGESEVPKERLALPNLQINVVRNLLSNEIIAKEAERRGLEATLDEKVAAIASTRRLAPFAPILEKGDENAEALAERGIELADLDKIATDIVLRDKLHDALAADIPEEALWQEYKRQNNQIKLLLVGMRNTPSMEEITALVEQKPERIEAHFEANKKSYRQPTMVRLTMLSPKRTERVEPATLDEAAKRLDKGEAPEKIAKDLGLRSETGALLVRGENAKAFDAEAGSTGFQVQGPRGPYAWKVEGHRESKDAELTAALEREIAAELLGGESIPPKRRAQAEAVIKAMEELPTETKGEKAGTVPQGVLDDFEDRMKAKRYQVERTPLFPKNDRGFIPGVGLAEEVAAKAFTLDLEDPVADEPILSRKNVWTVRVLDRRQKTKADFEKDKDAFKKVFEARTKGQLVPGFVSKYEDEHNARLDLKPLRIKYGTLQKN